MAINPVRAFLFLLGGGAAALATAYYSGALDPYLFGPPTPPAEVAKLEDPAAADDKGDRPPAPETAAEPAPAAEGAPAEPAAARFVPSFDVVRVEPDGSVVIAGKATPGATIEVLAGGAVLGSAVADAGGDFAIVFDEPLKPGIRVVIR